MGVYSRYQKLQAVATETLNMMKMNNGWDNSMRSFYEDICTDVKMNPNEIKMVTATESTTSQPIQRGDPVTIELETEYEVHSVRPLKDKVITIPIHVKLTGLAQQFVRQ